MSPCEGTWQLSIATPLGRQTALLTIWHDEAGLRGTARSGAEVVEMLEPAFHGDQLSWTQKVTRPLRLTLVFAVRVEADHMTGTAKAGFLPASRVQGERVG